MVGVTTMVRRGLAVQLVLFGSLLPVACTTMMVVGTAPLVPPTGEEETVPAATSAVAAAKSERTTPTTSKRSSSSSLVRHRRLVLDVDAFMEQVNPSFLHQQRQRHVKEEEETKGGKGTNEKKKKKTKGHCGDDDYLSDLFDCDDYRFSMSMSMQVDPKNPSSPRPPSALTTLWPASPTVVPAPSRPTIPIAPPPPNVPTTAPYKTCRSLDRSQAVLNALRQGPADTTTTTTTTPVGPALDWLIFQDPAMIDPCTVGDDNDNDDPTMLSLTQRYALAAIYFDTNGSNWTQKDRWLTGSSECSWHGVTCDLSSTRGNIVTELVLAENNLAGSLPNELALLTDLTSVSVYRNALMGTLPTRWSDRLTKLDVEQNQLSGPGFAALTNHTNLASYRISSNRLTGTIPATFLTSNAATLQELWFANNQIQGVIPTELGAASTITSLILYKNQLTGTLPSTIGNLSQLQRLFAHDNSLSGPLPSGLFRSNRLKELRLEQNIFTGTVPTDIGRITAIEDLRMGENSFTGTLPSEIMALTNLVIFTANATGFTGTIIDAFTSFARLEFVDLSSNKLLGTIPATIFTTPIEFLYLSDNMLNGTLPSGFASAADLVDLYLFNNALNGTVPAINAGQLTTLSEFRIENNVITGTMPASICALRVGNTTATTTNTTGLVTLISDCGGPLPQIRCDCCNSCVTSP